MHGGSAVIARILLIGVLVLHVEACTSWKTQQATPAQVVAKKPNQVRVRLGNGSTMVLPHPNIVGDSLVGTPSGSDPKRVGRQLAVALSDIGSVEVQRVNAGKTALLIAGVGVTALAIAAAASSDKETPVCSDNCHPTVSCPLVYSWDGHSWRLDSGTFGGAISPALARTDLDNLIYAVPQQGVLRLRVANELNETDYLDALSVVAVDHAPGLTVAPGSNGEIYALGTLVTPRTARDDRGKNALPRLQVQDGWSWESTPSRRDTSRTSDVRDGLELSFPRPRGPEARLVVDGNNTPWAAHLTQELVAAHGRATRAWYDSLAAYPTLAQGLGQMMAREAFLGVSVWAGGKWEHQGYIWEAGPEIMKRQVFPLDLSRVETDTVRIRLESAPSFWLIDHVALAGAENSPTLVTELWSESAIDQHGISVRPLIGAFDGRSYVMENGAAAELHFRTPPEQAGMVRTYLVRSSGWYRIHTTEAKTPDIALLRKVLTEQFGASRVAVGRMNDAMMALGVE